MHFGFQQERKPLLSSQRFSQSHLYALRAQVPSGIPSGSAVSWPQMPSITVASFLSTLSKIQKAPLPK